jgi:hypothetical protein
MIIPGRGFAGLVLAAIALGCDRGPGAYRGAGLAADTLAVSDMVAAYRAALGGAFTLGDPTLSILVDPLLLPRTSGLAGGDTMPADVLSALRSSGVVLGVCKIPITASGVPLVCPADRAGYVARFSSPFALPGDTVQVHLVVQQYSIAGGRPEQRLRFERAYYVARVGSTWRAVREARLSAP